MTKRVSTTRITCSIALATMLVFAPFAAEVAWARQDISIGQSGDPTDGEDFDSGGSSGPVRGGGAADSSAVKTPTSVVLLVPMLSGGLLVFRVVVIHLIIGDR